MIENAPTLLGGLAGAALVLGVALFLLRSYRKGLQSERDEYLGAMGSPALEAMMEEARRQRELLNRREGGGERGGRPPAAP